MKDILNILKNYVLYLVSILFLEFSFTIIMHNNLTIESVTNILLFSIIISAFFSMISNIFKSKISFIITSIILFSFAILFSTQCLFFKTFKVYFAWSNLGISDQLNSFMGNVFKCIIENILYIFIFMLPFIVNIIFHKKFKLTKNIWKDYVAYLLVIVLFIPVLYLHINSTKGKMHSSYDLLYKVNDVDLNINKFGVLNSYVIDLYRTTIGFKEKIVTVGDIDDNSKKDDKKEVVYEPNTIKLDFTKETNNNKIKMINDYIENDKGTMKNEYTGIFKDYNLIYITAESFSELGVSKELTPTLYKLIHSGFIFDNYYTPNVLSTIGGEFQSILGLYPDSSILKTWRSGENYFPYGLSTTFKKLGYKTYAYHNNSYAFQDRYKYLKSQGFDNFKACYNGMEKLINCKKWPQSDDDMMNVTLPDYVDNKEPFLAYYMTVSGHFAYSFSDNSMATKHRNEVKDLNNLSEEAKAYIATQIELDKALERIITTLEEKGKLDKTVIVLLADHYPYELSNNAVSMLSSYDRDNVVEINHNALIIWNNKLEDKHITKPCMSSDVIPTVYNLFGVDYDSRLFTGRDILSNSTGLAVFKNHSWVTDKGTYFAASSKFVPRENVSVDDEYVKNINSTVNNRLNISKMILETNYYDYLLK